MPGLAPGIDVFSRRSQDVKADKGSSHNLDAARPMLAVLPLSDCAS